MNLWVENYLRQFTNGRQTDWATYLPMAEYAHNSWKHDGTKHTPHQLIMGIKPQATWNSVDDAIPSVEN